MDLRAFVAIELAAPLRHRLAALRDRLDLRPARIKWVEEENLHVTLKFLGDVPEAAVAEIGAGLERSVAGESPFEISLHGLGVMPPGRDARVVFVKIAENEEKVKRLAANIDKYLEASGIAPELRPFQAHVTLGRVKHGPMPGDLEARLGEVDAGMMGRERVESIALKASRLTPSGPIYTTLRSVPLPGRDAGSAGGRGVGLEG